MSFPFFRQSDEKTCGATCLRMIARYYGKSLEFSSVLEQSQTTREGVSLLGLLEASEKNGMHARGIQLDFEQLGDSPLPCIAYWKQNHFVVIYKIRKNRIYVADPGYGLLVYKTEEFLKSWADRENNLGIVLLIE